MEGDIARILLHHDEIRARVREVAREIVGVYVTAEEPDPPLTLVPVLAGSIIFVADLIRELPVKMKIGLVQMSAYPGPRTQAQDAKTLIELSGDLRDRHVLIVDDILDSGKTLGRVRRILRQYEPRSVRSVVLLRKPGKAPADVRADFVGFDIDDEFVVGYGLDFDDHYRNFPHIGVLRPELMP